VGRQFAKRGDFLGKEYPFYFSSSRRIILQKQCPYTQKALATFFTSHVSLGCKTRALVFGLRAAICAPAAIFHFAVGSNFLFSDQTGGG